MRSCMCCGPAAHGGPCPTATRTGAPSTTTSPAGPPTAPWHSCTRCYAVTPTAAVIDSQSVRASTQDRDGGRRLLWRRHRHFPSLRLVWADAGYAGKLATWAQQALTLTLQIVRKRQGVHRFEVLPRRGVVE